MTRIIKLSATLVIGTGILLGNASSQHFAAAQEPVRANQDRALIVPVAESPIPESADPTSADPTSADTGLSTARPRSEIEQWEKAWQVKPLSNRAASTTNYSTLTFIKQPAQTEVLTNQRSLQANDVYWHASGLFSQPTYFEDVDLENYGHVHFLQPVKSGAKFCADVVLLPWEVCRKHPTVRVYSLGLERPGNPTHSVREHRH